MQWTVHGEKPLYQDEWLDIRTWEIPFGRSDPGEDLAHAAARETEEETGWRPGPLTPLLKVEPTAGLRACCDRARGDLVGDY